MTNKYLYMQIGKNIQVWTKRISPGGKSIAFTFLNTAEGGSATKVM